MSALRRGRPDVGCDSYSGVRADRPVRYQRVAKIVRRYLCRASSQCHDVREVAVQRGDTSHERVPGVKGAQ